jgi:DNA polymerase (family 10)
MMKNQDVARLLDETADLLEFSGENPFRVNAFRNAARAIRNLAGDIETLGREKRLKEVRGIGSGISAMVEEFLASGSIASLEELRSKVPQELVRLMGVQGLGPKTLQALHRSLGLRTVEDLRAALDSGSALTVPGLGPKKVETIRKGLELFVKGGERLLLPEARDLAERAMAPLRPLRGVLRIEAAGSLRRWCETVGDIDLVCAGGDGGGIIETFLRQPFVAEIVAGGPTKASVRTHGGRQIDLRLVPEASYGAALQYFTGAKAHNVRLREIARARGLKINEYGVFRGEECVGGGAEEDVYAAAGLPWIPPELREDLGEIEAARDGALPALLTSGDVRGDLHAHSDWSDGHMSIEALARLARDRGYGYVVVSDHSRAASYAGGLTPDRLRAQWEEIRRVRRDVPGIEILASSEVDILSDGRLDLPDDILRQLDWVVASVHSGFKQNVTERICRAMENPWVDVIAHPTGRLISRRAGYEIDLERILEHAALTGTALEISGSPDRLDLSDVNARRARDLGVRIALGTDSHNPGDLDQMEYGVHVARRAGLAPSDIVNSLEAAELAAGRKSARGAAGPPA